jgi:hypothetical protein
MVSMVGASVSDDAGAVGVGLTLVRGVLTAGRSDVVVDVIIAADSDDDAMG